MKSNALSIIGCLGSLVLCTATFAQPDPDLPATEPFSLPLPPPAAPEPSPFKSEPSQPGIQAEATPSPETPNALELDALEPNAQEPNAQEPNAQEPNAQEPNAQELDALPSSSAPGEGTDNGDAQPLEELAQPSPPANNRAAAMADAAKRFGSFDAIDDITIDVKLPPQGTQSLPQLFAVRASQAEDVEYLSPPFQRPWENMVLRPHARYGHEPLYFEEVNLERYGLRRPIIQPACSAAHFFGGILLLPYKVTQDPAHQPFFHHHPYLAGVNGCERRPIRLEAGPAVVQAATATGLFFIAP